MLTIPHRYMDRCKEMQKQHSFAYFVNYLRPCNCLSKSFLHQTFSNWPRWIDTALRQKKREVGSVNSKNGGTYRGQNKEYLFGRFCIEIYYLDMAVSYSAMMGHPSPSQDIKMAIHFQIITNYRVLVEHFFKQTLHLLIPKQYLRMVIPWCCRSYHVWFSV